MTSKISHGASGAIRRFAGRVARVRSAIRCSKASATGISSGTPSQMETCFALFANVLELDDSGQPVNEKHAEKHAATWIYQYCTGKLPPGQPNLEPWETKLY